MENGKIRMPRKPQLPTELVIHYIVKDYQRMFEERDSFLARIAKAQKKVEELEDKNYKLRKNSEKQSTAYEERLQKAAKEIAAKDKELEELRSLTTEMQRQIKKLTEVIADPVKKAELLDELIHPRVIGKDDMKWVDDSLRQLQKANEKLEVVEQWCAEFHGLLEMAVEKGMDSGVIHSAIGRLPKVFNKTNSALQRIDNFFKIVGSIEMKL